MNHAEQRLQLKCPSCAGQWPCGINDMLDRLRQLGMLRRCAEPAPEMVLELFVASATRLRCQECGAAGLVVRTLPDDWDDHRICAVCAQPIPAERLRLFPQATHCVTCQERQEKGTADPTDYCPKCGTPMTLRLQSGSKTTRYTLWCPQCRSRET